MDVAGVVSDPIGWLVGQGLNFLLAVCQPLQDAIHFVSGDGPSLAQWAGEASRTAGEKLGEFAGGIRGTAGKAGDIAGMADRRNAGFGRSMLDAVTGEAQAQVGMPGQPGGAPRPGKPVGHAENARKAGEYAATGDDQSVSETSEKLDF